MAIPTNPGLGNLDQTQIMQRVFNENTDRLRTDAEVTGSFTGDINCEIDAVDGDNIAIANADGSLKATLSIVDGKNAIDVNVANQIQSEPTGLSKAIRTTVLIIDQTPQRVPTASLLDRNTMSIRVMGTNTVYFGGSTVNVSVGYPKFQFEEIIADIKDNPSVDIWAVCETGKTCEIRILEIA